MRAALGSVGDVRARMAERLRTRHDEIVGTIFARVRDGSLGTAGVDSVEYVAGLRAAVAAAVECGIRGIELGEDGLLIPATALEQARRAARIGVRLDTVLRRYVLGYTLLEQFVVEEAERGEDSSSLAHRGALRDALRAQALVLDRLLAAITSEYGDEAGLAGRSWTAGAGVAALPALLSNPSAHRARECLLFLADHPGTSNREVASGIGVAHQPQISRLLSQLVAESLACKRSEGAGRRNAWRLTPRGEQALRMLTERRNDTFPLTGDITGNNGQELRPRVNLSC
jgi:hypothetical protein